MSDLNKLHKTAVETAEAVRQLQANLAGEATEENPYGSRETRANLKVARKAYDKAIWNFQNEIDAIGVQNAPNLKELYAEIGNVGL